MTNMNRKKDSSEKGTTEKDHFEKGKSGKDSSEKENSEKGQFWKGKPSEQAILNMTI